MFLFQEKSKYNLKYIDKVNYILYSINQSVLT